jgi:transposase
VREWVKQAEREAGTGDDGGLTSDERRELAELRGRTVGGAWTV